MTIGVLTNDKKFLTVLEHTFEEYHQRKFVEIQTIHFTRIRDYLASDELFDMLFVDDEFDNRNSVETARLIRTKDPKVALVLLAKNPDKVYDSFAVRAHRFYLKPVTQSKLFEALDAYRKDLFSYRVIIVRIDNSYHSLSTEEIVYLEADSKDCLIHLRQGVTRASASLIQMLLQLPEEYFFHSHRSYVVNMQYVRRIDPDALIMVTGDKVPLSRRRKVKFLVTYSRFISGHSFL